MEGTVKWFNGRNGYGFIIGEDGKEYFVHKTFLKEGKFLRENDRVSFEPDEGEKGPIAKDVVLLQKGSEIAPRSEESQEVSAELSDEPVEEQTEEDQEE